MKWLPFFLFLIPGLVLAYADIKYRVLPDFITLPLIGVGLIYNLVLLYRGNLMLGLNGLSGGAFVCLLFLILSVFTKGGDIGGGDIKLSIALGFWMGFTWIVFIIMAAAISALVFVGIRQLLSKWIYWPLAPGQLDTSSPYPIPFGVFLVIVTVIILVPVYHGFIIGGNL